VATNTLAIFELIENARTPSDLFSGDGQAEYRRLARLCHPDLHRGSKRAEQVFQRLSELYAQLNTHDKKPTFTPVTIGKWVATEAFAAGHICDLFAVESAKHTGRAVLKIARQENDNDLLEREAAALTKAFAPSAKRDNSFTVYLPALLDSFEASGRKANVLSLDETGMTLDKIVAKLGPLDFRHLVWMGNRLWSALGFIHRLGIINGAVLPEHLLYRASDHGMVLLDWCYSVSDIGTGYIPAMVETREEFYPPEVRRKFCNSCTDIYMAAYCLRQAAQSIPKRFDAFFDWLLVGSPASRPTDAWAVQDKWKELAREEFGPPKFLPIDF